MTQCKLDIFINQSDVYQHIDFRRFPEIGEVYWNSCEIKDHQNITVILTGLKDIIDDKFLAPFTNIQYIGSNTTGIDHIRTSRDIQIIHLDPSDVQEVSATAEFTLALLLALVRKIPFIDYKNLSNWTLECRGMQFRHKKIGIFGLGRLGKKMARYAQALEMEVCSYDRHSTPEDKKDLLKTSDVITIHLPLNNGTVNFIDAGEFELMERKPFIVNTSRPQIVNKKALIKALKMGQISGAAMDFINYDGSTHWDPELQRLRGENFLLTPHMAGNTHESVQFTAEIVTNKLIRNFRESGFCSSQSKNVK